ncbi:MAG: hypothetical protein IKZ99_09945 [Salinivirgaceae bacterium]|nr:hypothetical protein [Salinivirgaceae bacterium]
MKGITNIVKLTLAQSYPQIVLSINQAKVRENRRKVRAMSMKDWDKQMSEVLKLKPITNNVSPKE